MGGLTLKSKRKIFCRDGLLCQLCGVRVRLDVIQTHPHRATVDHILPVSKGGGNNADNLRTCCRQCNHLRGNGEQKKLRELRAAERGKYVYDAKQKVTLEEADRYRKRLTARDTVA